MKLKKLLIVPILILFFVSLFLYWKFNYPNDEAIKREFLDEHPNVEIISHEMIFDWEPKRIVSYLVKYKQSPNKEMFTDEFALKQHWNFRWNWCNDQTERKCS